MRERVDGPTLHLLTQSVTDHTVATGSTNLNRGVALACGAAAPTTCYELPPKRSTERPWRPDGVRVVTCDTPDGLLAQLQRDLTPGSVVVKFWAALRGEDWRADLAVARLAARRGIRCVYVDTDAMWRLPQMLTGGVAHLPAALQAYSAVLLFFGGPRAAREYRTLSSAPVHVVSAAVSALALPPAPPDPMDGRQFDLACVVSNFGERERRTLAMLERLVRRRPGTSIVLAGRWPESAGRLPGAQLYPAADPADLLRLYGRCRFTLNPMRSDFAGYSHTASIRLFEAAAAGSVIVTEFFPGLAGYFEPGRECLVYRDADDLARLLDLSEHRRLAVAARAGRRLGRESAAAADEVVRLLVDAPRVAVGPVTASLEEEPYALASRMADVTAVAVLPGCTDRFRRCLAAAFPHVRLVPVERAQDAVRSGMPVVATTDVEKEATDTALARGGAVRAVLVEIGAAPPGQSLRWVSGRDWTLPGLPGSEKL